MESVGWSVENKKWCSQKHVSCFFPSQRPRKVGAKFSGTGFAPDEHDQIQLALDYDGKRDRWNGYDPEEHMRIVEEYSKVDLVTSNCERR